MSALNSFIRAVETVKTYHPQPWTHCKIHPDHAVEIIEDMKHRGITAGPFDQLLGYVIELDRAVPL